MNIIIAGDGEVGVHLAQSLTELDHNITVVDPHSELLKRLESETDLLTITGDSTSPQVLQDAGVGGCDLFLSVLHDESINLVTCILAKKLKAKKTYYMRYRPVMKKSGKKYFGAWSRTFKVKTK